VKIEDAMIEKTARKCRLEDHDQAREDLAYWLSKTPEERVAAVDFLRRQVHGTDQRLQRVARVIKLSSG
jgi:hypothetical protein